MNTLRSVRRSALVACAVLVPLVVGCDSSTEPPPALVGTWNATSLLIGGIDLIDDGMTLRFTFTADGEYSFTVTNDLADFCDPGPNCSDSGDYTATSGQITFDPGEETEETFAYNISGSTLTVSGMIDAVGFAFTFEKQ